MRGYQSKLIASAHNRALEWRGLTVVASLIWRVAAFAARIFSGHREAPGHVCDWIDNHANESNDNKESYIKKEFDDLKKRNHGYVKPNRPNMKQMTAPRKVLTCLNFRWRVMNCIPVVVYTCLCFFPHPKPTTSPPPPPHTSSSRRNRQMY